MGITYAQYLTFAFDQSDMIGNLITEIIGTFFLYLTICFAGVFGLSGQNASFAIAGTLMVMIHAGALTLGSISLASFNPAVSLSLVVVGKMAAADLWLHLVPQLFGAGAASLVYKWNT